MQARRAARELALILFSQFDKNITTYTDKDIENIILKSVRTLTNNAFEEVNMTVSALIQMKEFVENYEADHEENLKRPINVSNVPVPMPMTSDMVERIDELIDIADKSLTALEIAEMTTLEEKSDVKNYLLNIAKNYRLNHETIDDEIQKFSLGWNINRLVKIDKDILRIAICELLYIQDAPLKVVIDEALELAKKYSTDDSASFINGILGKVVEENKINK